MSNALKNETLGSPPVRRTWVVAVGFSALLAALPARAEPPDEVTEAEVRTQVAALEDPRFAERERASEALCAMGAAVGPFLLPLRDHADLEVRTRVREIVARLGLMTADEEAELARHLADFWIARGSARHAALFRAIGVSVAAGSRIREVLAWPSEGVTAELRAPVSWIRAGAPWPAPWKMLLRNAGARRILVPAHHNRLRSSQGLAPLVPGRSGVFSGRRGGSLNVGARGTVDVLSNATALDPGGDYELTPWVSPAAPNEVGWRTERATFEVRAQVSAGGHALDIGPPGSDPVSGCLRASAKVLILPDSTAPHALAGVSLAIERVSPGLVAGGSLGFELVLDHGGTAVARLDADWTRYVWVALVPKDPAIALIPRVATALALSGVEDQAPALRAPLDLGPGATLRCELAWNDVAAGEYLLIAAYEDPSPASSGYLVGRVVAAEVAVSVAADGNK